MKQITFGSAGRGGALAGVLLGLTACAGEGTGDAGADVTAYGSLDAGAVPTASLSTGEADAVSGSTRQLPDRASTLASGNDALPRMPRTEIGVESSTDAPSTAAALPSTTPDRTSPVTVEPVAEAPFALVPAPAVEAAPSATADVEDTPEPLERQLAAPEVEAVAEVEADTETAVEAVAGNDVETAPEPEPEVVAEAESEPETASEPALEVVAEVAPAPEFVAEVAPAPEVVAEVAPEPEIVAEAETEAESEVVAEAETSTDHDAEPENAAALPLDDGYSVRISWNPAAGSDLGYYVYYGADDESVGTMARSITRDEADAGGDLRTALLDAPGDIESGLGSRVCFSVSAWNSTGETARSPVRCVDTPSS